METNLKLLSQLILVLLLVYVLFSALIYFRQDSLIFYPNFPSRELTSTPSHIGLSYESISLTTEDSTILHGWFISHPQEKAVVVFFHGNAGNISHRIQTIQLMHELALSVLIFDYRGYGKSQGKVSEKGLYLDAKAAWSYLTTSMGYENNDIVIWGRSLGAAIAANLAANKQAKAVILESTFTSVPDMASQLYPFLPVRWMSRYQLNVKQSVSAINSPLLIVHSRDDEIIPFSHGEKLFEFANQPKSFLVIQGSHDAGIFVSAKAYTNKVQVFLDSL